MMTDALLAYGHLAAILAAVVFLSSEAALCRTEWLNAAAVKRLVRLDTLYAASATAILLTGAARALWGVKGLDWYVSQPLLWLKVALFVLIAALSLRPARAFRAWHRQLEGGGALPAAAAVLTMRRRVMLNAHLLALIPLAAVLMARGLFTR